MKFGLLSEKKGLILDSSVGLTLLGDGSGCPSSVSSCSARVLKDTTQCEFTHCWLCLGNSS